MRPTKPTDRPFAPLAETRLDARSTTHPAPPLREAGVAALKDAVVEVEGVHKTFAGVEVLRGVDLSVAAGEFLAILGPSGAGKSTLLRCIAGIVEPDRGRVQVAGRTISDVPPSDRGVGFVYQDHALFPRMTVEQNVQFPLLARRRRTLLQCVAGAFERRSLREEDQTRVRAALELVRMTRHAAKRPSELSGGECQRVALARALVAAPRIVCMDEPLNSLDASLRREMQEEIRRIHDALGTSIVYVTHDQDEAFRLADRIAILMDGTIAQVGAPAEVHSAPATVSVAQFVGTCNIVPIDRVETTADGFLSYSLAGLAFRTSRHPRPGYDVLGIRPNVCRIERVGGGEPPLNRGTVAARTFLGDRVRLSVLLAAGERFEIDVDPVSSGTSIAVGDAVAFDALPGTVMTLPNPNHRVPPASP